MCNKSYGFWIMVSQLKLLNGSPGYSSGLGARCYSGPKAIATVDLGSPLEGSWVKPTVPCGRSQKAGMANIQQSLISKSGHYVCEVCAYMRIYNLMASPELFALAPQLSSQDLNSTPYLNLQRTPQKNQGLSLCLVFR